jgi:hyperosmotically inducible periplasmic protein
MKLSSVGLVALLTLAAPYVASAQTTAPATQATDEQLDSRIATSIANDPTLKADAVKVKVEHGVVTLSGMVATKADKARAERLAHIPGVVRVENNLTTREGAKDKVKGTAGKVGDKSKDIGGKVVDKTKEIGSKTGEVTTDGWISTRIKTNFMGEEALRSSDIKVDTDNHVVTLTGTVVSAAARAKAVSIAKDVEGVHRVVDKLTIMPKP